uniref:Uncharacterized protein n=1 Tax=Avena sativa TaxID=4498 RepID=A0ACD5XKB1_AVESA
MAHQRAAAMLAVLGVIASIFAAGTALWPVSAGVCYGVHGDRLPSAAEVVQLYKSKGILNMRIYQPDVQTLLALKGSKINVLMGVADEDVPRLAASTSAAADWVKVNIQPYLPGVLFQYIAVGNEITGAATQNIAPAIKNLNAVLSATGLDDIQVSTAVRMDVLSSSSPPSSSTFKDGNIKDVLAVLNSTYATGITAPLLVNVYPYFAYTGDTKNIDLNFALFQPSSTVIRDNGLNYTNLFDAMVDDLYAALSRENLVVPVVVSESGWPSYGGVGASVTNAQTYNQNLINHIRNGTPKRPYWLETYVFAMFNENQKTGAETGAETEKHFGLFNPDKSPVYPIKFRMIHVCKGCGFQ